MTKPKVTAVQWSPAAVSALNDLQNATGECILGLMVADDRGGIAVLVAEAVPDGLGMLLSLAIGMATEVWLVAGQKPQN